MANDNEQLSIVKGLKNIFFVVTIGYDEQGNRLDFNNVERNNVKKFFSMPIKLDSGRNLSTALGAYYNSKYCETYKGANKIAEQWNESYRYNGTLADLA